MNFFSNLLPYPAKEIIEAMFLAKLKLFTNVNIADLTKELTTKNKILVDNLIIDNAVFNENFLQDINLELIHSQIKNLNFSFPKNYMAEKTSFEVDNVCLVFKLTERKEINKEIVDEENTSNKTKKIDPLASLFEKAAGIILHKLRFRIGNLRIIVIKDNESSGRKNSINPNSKSNTNYIVTEFLIQDLIYDKLDKEEVKKVFLHNKRISISGIYTRVYTVENSNSPTSLDKVLNIYFDNKEDKQKLNNLNIKDIRENSFFSFTSNIDKQFAFVLEFKQIGTTLETNIDSSSFEFNFSSNEVKNLCYVISNIRCSKYKNSSKEENKDGEDNNKKDVNINKNQESNTIKTSKAPTTTTIATKKYEFTLLGVKITKFDFNFSVKIVYLLLFKNQYNSKSSNIEINAVNKTWINTDNPDNIDNLNLSNNKNYSLLYYNNIPSLNNSFILLLIRDVKNKIEIDTSSFNKITTSSKEKINIIGNSVITVSQISIDLIKNNNKDHQISSNSLLSINGISLQTKKLEYSDNSNTSNNEDTNKLLIETKNITLNILIDVESIKNEIDIKYILMVYPILKELLDSIKIVNTELIKPILCNDLSIIKGYNDKLSGFANENNSIEVKSEINSISVYLFTSVTSISTSFIINKNDNNSLDDYYSYCLQQLLISIKNINSKSIYQSNINENDNEFNEHFNKIALRHDNDNSKTEVILALEQLTCFSEKKYIIEAKSRNIKEINYDAENIHEEIDFESNKDSENLSFFLNIEKLSISSTIINNINSSSKNSTEAILLNSYLSKINISNVMKEFISTSVNTSQSPAYLTLINDYSKLSSQIKNNSLIKLSLSHNVNFINTLSSQTSLINSKQILISKLKLKKNMCSLVDLSINQNITVLLSTMNLTYNNVNINLYSNVIQNSNRNENNSIFSINMIKKDDFISKINEFSKELEYLSNILEVSSVVENNSNDYGVSNKDNNTENVLMFSFNINKKLSLLLDNDKLLDLELENIRFNKLTIPHYNNKPSTTINNTNNNSNNKNYITKYSNNIISLTLEDINLKLKKTLKKSIKKTNVFTHTSNKTSNTFNTNQTLTSNLTSLSNNSKDSINDYIDIQEQIIFKPKYKSFFETNNEADGISSSYYKNNNSNNLINNCGKEKPPKNYNQYNFCENLIFYSEKNSLKNENLNIFLLKNEFNIDINTLCKEVKLLKKQTKNITVYSHFSEIGLKHFDVKNIEKLKERVKKINSNINNDDGYDNSCNNGNSSNFVDLTFKADLKVKKIIFDYQPINQLNSYYIYINKTTNVENNFQYNSNSNSASNSNNILNTNNNVINNLQKTELTALYANQLRFYHRALLITDTLSINSKLTIDKNNKHISLNIKQDKLGIWLLKNLNFTDTFEEYYHCYRESQIIKKGFINVFDAYDVSCNFSNNFSLFNIDLFCSGAYASLSKDSFKLIGVILKEINENIRKSFKQAKDKINNNFNNTNLRSKFSGVIEDQINEDNENYNNAYISKERGCFAEYNDENDSNYDDEDNIITETNNKDEEHDSLLKNSNNINNNITYINLTNPHSIPSNLKNNNHISSLLNNMSNSNNQINQFLLEVNQLDRIHRTKMKIQERKSRYTENYDPNSINNLSINNNFNLNANKDTLSSIYTATQNSNSDIFNTTTISSVSILADDSNYITNVQPNYIDAGKSNFENNDIAHNDYNLNTVILGKIEFTLRIKNIEVEFFSGSDFTFEESYKSSISNNMNNSNNNNSNLIINGYSSSFKTKTSENINSPLKNNKNMLKDPPTTKSIKTVKSSNQSSKLNISNYEQEIYEKRKIRIRIESRDNKNSLKLKLKSLEIENKADLIYEITTNSSILHQNPVSYNENTVKSNNSNKISEKDEKNYNREKQLEILSEKHTIEINFMLINLKNILIIDNIEKSSIKTCFSKTKFNEGNVYLFSSQIVKCPVKKENQNQYLVYCKLNDISLFLDYMTILFAFEFFEIDIEKLLYNSNNTSNNSNRKYDYSNKNSYSNKVSNPESTYSKDSFFSSFYIKKFFFEPFISSITFISNDYPSLNSIQKLNIDIINLSSFKDIKLEFPEINLKNTSITQIESKLYNDILVMVSDQLLDKYLKSTSLLKPLREVFSSFTNMFSNPLKNLVQNQNRNTFEVIEENVRGFFITIVKESLMVGDMIRKEKQNRIGLFTRCTHLLDNKKKLEDEFFYKI